MSSPAFPPHAIKSLKFNARERKHRPDSLACCVSQPYFITHMYHINKFNMADSTACICVPSLASPADQQVNAELAKQNT